MRLRQARSLVSTQAETKVDSYVRDQVVIPVRGIVAVITWDRLLDQHHDPIQEELWSALWSKHRER